MFYFSLTFPFTSAWKPTKDDNSEYVKMSSTEVYLITGIQIAGRDSNMAIKYRHLIKLGTSVIGLLVKC